MGLADRLCVVIDTVCSGHHPRDRCHHGELRRGHGTDLRRGCGGQADRAGCRAPDRRVARVSRHGVSHTRDPSASNIYDHTCFVTFATFLSLLVPSLTDCSCGCRVIFKADKGPTAWAAHNEPVELEYELWVNQTGNLVKRFVENGRELPSNHPSSPGGGARDAPTR